jgi:hypothetical protein
MSKLQTTNDQCRQVTVSKSKIEKNPSQNKNLPFFVRPIRAKMSKDLDCVSTIMYLREGDIPDNEEKRLRLEKKIEEWNRDVVMDVTSKQKLSQESKLKMAEDFWEIESKYAGYWCEGEKCYCERTHWVLFSRQTFCYECMHDPCACNAPLIWDEEENAYYRVWESVNLEIQRILWMSPPASSTAMKKWRLEEKKRKEMLEVEKEERECYENQSIARKQGFCCHAHAVSIKKEKKEDGTRKKARVDGPDHCILCDEEPCVFVQIESRLGEHDLIYFDKTEFDENSVACNRARRNRAYKYAAYILWERIGYRRPHYKCVETGIRALSPPLDGKITGYKEK